MDKYVLLEGAKKNFGDFLIVDRAKKLLRKYKPGIEFVELPRWKPIDSYLEEVNAAKAIILCGGPAYNPKFYPGIYPLVKDLSSIRIPIIPFGLGWDAFPGDDVSCRYFTFTSSSLRLLQKIHSNCVFSSCRDYPTKRVLSRHGFKNVLMTGDPAWYDLKFIEKEFIPPYKINVIAFSLPQKRIYYKQSLAVVKVLKKLFPKSKLICTFHRGIEADKYTSIREARGLQELKAALEELSLCDEIVNLAYNLSRGMEIYSNCDLHVGYRLHAHILFLSHRKPSFLIEEDGRGRGFSETVGLYGIPASAHTTLGNFLDKGHLPGKLRGAFNRIGLVATSRRTVADELQDFISEELENGFLRFRGLGTVFKGYYRFMEQFLESLP